MKKNASITAPIASLLFMGLGQIAILRQYVKGILFAIVEILVLLNFDKIFKGIKGFITLGVQAKPGTPIPQRDHSIFMMLDGLIVIVIVVIIAILYVVNVVDARKGGKSLESNGKFQSTREFISQTADKAFAYIALSPAFVMIAFFVVIPLVFSALVAFTNYSAPHHIPPNNKVDWVGFQTFKDMVSLKQYSQGFARTAVWTLEWALLGTITTYFGGLFMALALLDKKIKLSKFFRTVFILPYAVPGMISLFIWQNLLNGQFGPITRTLRELGVVQWLMDTGILTKNLIPWLTDPTLAKTMLIIVNLWLGFPYFMLLITGIMTSMPQDLYEAATIDGANKSQQFRYITLPLLLYQTIPLMIMSFSYNMNNFGGVFFLTNGNPSDTVTTQSFAGSTDILISWMYKFTYDQRLYNKASVVAICMFLVIAPFALYNFSQTKSFKDGEI